MTITEIIREALDRYEYSCEVFLDFQKAFDSVNMGKLNHYDMRGLYLGWFKSYLTNRQQKTSVKGIFSNSLTVFIWCTTVVCIGPTSIFDLHQ